MQSLILNSDKIKAENHIITKQKVELQEKDIYQEFGTLNTISHMLRTPITIILGLIQQLSAKQLTDEQQQCISDIKSATDQLLVNITLILEKLDKDQNNG